jgi:MFS family permease
MAPTCVRWQVLWIATAASFMLYVDRYFLAELLKNESVKTELGLDLDKLSWTLGAFFWSYALLQVPAGWLADRFGPRWLLTVYVVGWSVFAAGMGWATGVVSLFIVRFGLGAMQAGAYPTSGNLISRWVPLADRGTASALVSFGGRFGAASALYLTTKLLLWSGSWRWIMVLYGACGCVVGLAFALIARDWPWQHPNVNDAELTIIERGRGSDRQAMISAPPTADLGRAFKQVVRSFSMWAMCLTQVTTNVGWVFLVIWLPSYLVQARHVEKQLGANMNAITLIAGMAGMLLGGRLTDSISRSFGVRHGRALPIAVSRFVAAGAYLAVPYLESPWTAIAAFCLVSFATDVGLPGMWAYMQDVSGRYSGAVFGWGNMWGNLGAAVAPVLVAKLCGEGENVNWNLALRLCAGAFVVSGVAAFFIDATKPVVQEGAA